MARYWKATQRAIWFNQRAILRIVQFVVSMAEFLGMPQTPLDNFKADMLGFKTKSETLFPDRADHYEGDSPLGEEEP